MNKTIAAMTFRTTALLTASFLSTSVVQAALTAEEVAQLGVTGTPLTPLGGERAGNAEGTIPPWTGGLSSPPPGFVPGGLHIDPFPNEQPLFTITTENYQQYADKLTPGQTGMFERYPDSWKMHIYPTHRTARYPDWVYEATRQTAQTIKLCGERCVEPESIADGGGIPFPIPKTGYEANMNANFAYYGKVLRFPGHSVVVTPSGDFAVSEIDLEFQHIYWMNAAEKPDAPFFNRSGGVWWCFGGMFTAPSRQAGQVLNGCGFMRDLRVDSYIYIPGQRRVRKAPEVGFYDQPAQGTDGLMTSHSRNGLYFSGSEEWFDYELIGKRERFMPYNNYRIMDPTLRAEDVILAGHADPQYIRYELHRAWEVEATLRDGYRNLQPRQAVYIDEDSWVSPMAERYNQQDQLWRYQERFVTYFYEPQAMFSAATVAYDMISGRWSSAIDSFPGFSGGFIDFSQPARFDLMTPQGIRMMGRR